jgi:glutamine phosphoribosylpyrophosphate amidotransferase
MTERFPDFLYNCDSDIVCHKMLQALKETGDLAAASRSVMESLDGAFSVTGITGDGEFFAFKDAQA